MNQTQAQQQTTRPAGIRAMDVALAAEAWAYAIARGDFQAARGHAADLRALGVSILWTGPKGRGDF